MRQLQDAFRGKQDIRLVSLALTGDEPELLQKFALDQQAYFEQWLFLTRKEGADEVLDVAEKCFFQTAQRKPDAKPGDEIDHTTNLLVIDREGRMRGYLDGRDPANLPSLIYNLFWRRFNTRGATWSIYGGLVSCVLLVLLSPVVSGSETALFPGSDFDLFPLSNPGIISIPFGFLCGYLGTITSKEPSSEEAYDELEVRSLTGAGAERAVVH